MVSPSLERLVSRHLRQLRLDAGFTQEGLSAATGLHLRTIQRAERCDGCGEWPTRYTLRTWERVCRERLARTS